MLSFGRCHSHNLLSTDPAYQYQTQKKIQNTVRVPSSLYTMNLGALSSYDNGPFKWNQMSDRNVAHFQTGSGGSQGSFYHGSSLKRSQTRERPGACTPGGYGVDIKHNSYSRYLNRLKGGKLLRRGPVPATYGLPIPFDPVYPVYGGKTVKTAIVGGSCGPLCSDDKALLYLSSSTSHPVEGSIVYKVGDTVYARTLPESLFRKATVVAVLDKDFYSIEFENENESSSIVSPALRQIIPYFPCNCDNNVSVQTLVSGKEAALCSVVNKITGPQYMNLIEKYGSLIYQYSYLPDYIDVE